MGSESSKYTKNKVYYCDICLAFHHGYERHGKMYRIYHKIFRRRNRKRAEDDRKRFELIRETEEDPVETAAPVETAEVVELDDWVNRQQPGETYAEYCVRMAREESKQRATEYIETFFKSHLQEQIEMGFNTTWYTHNNDPYDKNSWYQAFLNPLFRKEVVVQLENMGFEDVEIINNVRDYRPVTEYKISYKLPQTGNEPKVH